MRGLLEKDLRLMRGQLKFFVIVIFMAVFLGFQVSDNFEVTYLTMVSGYLVLNSISYDDSGNAVSFLMTLPVSRRLYVLEKYVFGFLTTFTGWLVGVAVSSAVSLVQGAMPTVSELIFNLTTVFGFMMFISLALPLVFKYGSEKGRTVMFVMMIVVFAGLYISVRVLRGVNINLDAMAERLPGQWIACLGVITLMVATVSCGMSMRIMQKKEFS